MLPLRRPRLTRRLSRPVSTARPILPLERTRLWDARGSTRSAGTAQAALGQVVVEVRSAWGHRDQAVFGPDGGQFGQVSLDLAPDPAQRDAEHPLAALEQVDHLVGGRALVDADPVAHQRHLGQVGAAAIAEVLDRGPDLLQRDPGVEQSLDDLQHQDVAEAVQALRAGAVGGAYARLDQRRARPVIELAVGDAGGGARGRPAVPDLARVRASLVRNPGHPGNLVVVEQGALRAGRGGGPAVRDSAVRDPASVVTPGYGHARLVQDLLAGEDLRAGAQRQRDGVGRPRAHLRAVGENEVRVEDPVPQRGDVHRAQLDVQYFQYVTEKIVRERPKG